MLDKIKRLLGVKDIPEEVTPLYRGARSEREFDQNDEPVLAEVFGRSHAVPAALVAPVFGDWLGASAALQAAGAARSPARGAALITAADRLGGCAALVLSARAGSRPDD